MKSPNPVTTSSLLGAKLKLANSVLKKSVGARVTAKLRLDVDPIYSLIHLSDSGKIKSEDPDQHSHTQTLKVVVPASLIERILNADPIVLRTILDIFGAERLLVSFDATDPQAQAATMHRLMELGLRSPKLELAGIAGKSDDKYLISLVYVRNSV